MSNIDLKFTKCGTFCDFQNITAFCHDCPALLCSKCRVSMHNTIANKWHNIMDFDNGRLEWSNKQMIRGIFEDKSLADDVFTEVTRNFPIRESYVPPIEPTTDSAHIWKCEKCTYDNPLFAQKCGMCFIFRKKDGSDNKKLEYESKILNFQSEMRQNFIELDDVCVTSPNIPMENIIYCFSRNKEQNSFRNWYERCYAKKKNFHIIYGVFEKKGFCLGINELNDQYYKIIEEKNKKIFDPFSDKNAVAQFLRSSELIDPTSVNRLNRLPIVLSQDRADETEVWDTLKNYKNLTDCQKRMIITELDLQNSSLLDSLINYLKDESLGGYLEGALENGNVKLIHLKQAVTDNLGIDRAFMFLNNNCVLCCGEFPIPEMCGLITCEHEFCKSCVLQWLQETIESKYPCKWMCPVCDENKYKTIDKNMFYGQLREILKDDKKSINMFETKLLHERLMDSPNFHWCANEECTNGFEAEGVNKIQCPSCRGYMCVNCNRLWKEEHENRTCEELELWMLKNDPNLSKLLQNIGIECPKCGMRYALAAGGCLHFDCKACGTKFCGGCYQLFVDNCGKAGCGMTNFHSHHPRNCLYFLRDYNPNQLENMLLNSDYPKLVNKPEKGCQFMITNDKLKDIPCNKEVHSTTGMCETHYKEYLVQFINRYQIDPADFADSDSLNLMLFQMVVPKLVKKKESDAEFKQRLLNEVKTKCLLYIPKGVQAAAANN